ncbi:ABC transporter permease [Paracoccus sp. PS-1]|uniref:ABC transporter permease n=1 Tax=unclassified Paracoccus (in: a-proteobacteria) TaxID=2688777 RepID=UPI001E477B5A|nr:MULTISPECIES: ABC transporter permease [unclassified Paracoccus (in: a-proteobacteria)]MDQ7262957.1 ABC transporter permease [Paracoccus sp. PS1]
MDLPMMLAGRGLGRIIALRLMRLGLLLLAAAAAAFALMKLSPVDPVDAYLGPAIARLGPEQKALIAAAWGLDQPVLAQFTRWLTRILSGDAGWSTAYGAPVRAVLAERILPSLLLTLPAWLLSGVLGFGLGIAAGIREGSLPDRIIRIYAYVTASAPTFWVALLALTLFSVNLGWTPLCCSGPIGALPQEVTWVQRLHHLILPLAVLSLLGIAQIALHTRAKVAELMKADHVLFALAQGARPGDIARRSIARNAALPALTIFFASIGEILGGAVLAEQVFAYPGLGRATVEAAMKGDVPLLLAITLLATLVVSTGNMLADILYRIVDPRMRGPAPVLREASEG